MSSVTAPHALASTPALRRRLVTELTLRGVPADRVTDAALVLSELVANAVRHGQPLVGDTLRVSWRVAGGQVRIAVSDGGEGPVGVAELPGPWATGGRGLAIVGALAAEWGVQASRMGTTVWARVPLAAASQGGVSLGRAPAPC